MPEQQQEIYRFSPYRYNTKNCGKYNIKWQQCIVDKKPSTLCELFFDQYLDCIQQKIAKNCNINTNV